MRMLYINIFLLIFGLSVASAERFQVVVVRGEVKNVSEGRIINNLEFINQKSTVFIPFGNYIVLIDANANIYEFFGERIVSLDTLKGKSIRSFSPPDIKTLYSHKRYRSEIKNDSGPPPIELYYPFFFSSELMVKDSIRLKWFLNTSQSGKYIVKITNVYVDLIFQKVVPDYECLIEFSEKHKVERELFVSIAMLGNEKRIITDDKKITFVESNFTFNDVTNSITSPAANLLIALFFEMKGPTDQALFYYQRAYELSGEMQAYKEFLTNFKIRWPSSR
jgi:hypothetical protein